MLLVSCAVLLGFVDEPGFEVGGGGGEEGGGGGAVVEEAGVRDAWRGRRGGGARAGVCFVTPALICSAGLLTMEQPEDGVAQQLLAPPLRVEDVGSRLLLLPAVERQRTALEKRDGRGGASEVRLVKVAVIASECWVEGVREWLWLTLGGGCCVSSAHHRCAAGEGANIVGERRVLTSLCHAAMHSSNDAI